MQAVSQSPFLQALGYAIASSLWQAALLWLIVCAINGTFKITSRQRYLIAFVVQLTTFVWFVFTLQYYYNVCAEAADALQTIINNNNYNIITATTGTDNGFHFSNLLLYVDKLLPYLSVAYLSLLLILLAKWIKSYLYINKIRTTGLSDIDNKWKLFVERMTIELNITDHVTIALSRLIKTPLTVGFIKPIILIPFASVMHLTTEQLEALILHELAHIRRADYILNLYQSIFEKVLFFNPFTQLIKRVIEKEREHSCDDWVMQFKYNPSMYAEALLKVAYMQTQPDLAMYAATAKKSNDLLMRVKRILNQPEKVFNYKQQLGALVLLTTILACVAFIKPSPANHKKITAATTKNIILKPVVEQVKNPLFNPASLFTKTVDETVKKVRQNHEVPVDAPKPPAPPKETAAPEIVYGNAINDLVNSEWQDEYQHSVAEAQKEIEKLNWQPAQLQKLIDTAAIKKYMKLAFDNKNLQLNFKALNESLNKIADFKVAPFKNFEAARQMFTQKVNTLNALKQQQINNVRTERQQLRRQQLIAQQHLKEEAALAKEAAEEDCNCDVAPAASVSPATFSFNGDNDNEENNGDAYSYTTGVAAPAGYTNSDNNTTFLRNTFKGSKVKAQVKTITITKEHSAKDKNYKIVIEIQ